MTHIVYHGIVCNYGQPLDNNIMFNHGQPPENGTMVEYGYYYGKTPKHYDIVYHGTPQSTMVNHKNMFNYIRFDSGNMFWYYVNMFCCGTCYHGQSC